MLLRERVVGGCGCGWCVVVLVVLLLLLPLLLLLLLHGVITIIIVFFTTAATTTASSSRGWKPRQFLKRYAWRLDRLNKWRKPHERC